MLKPSRLVLFVLLLTAALALPRAGHHTPDSQQYIALAKHFRGEVPRERLRGPFAYRPLVPYLVARLPLGDLDVNFTLINISATVLAYLLFIPYLRRFVTSSTALNVGMLMLVVSLPTFDYSSGVLSDPVGFFFVAVAVSLLLNESYFGSTAAICLGVLAREALLSVAVVSVIDLVLGAVGREKKDWKRVLTILPLVTIPPIAVRAGSPTTLVTKWLGPLLDRLFGGARRGDAGGV